MKIFRKVTDFVYQRKVENAIAMAEKNKADLEYIAMMSDVELDDEEDLADEE